MANESAITAVRGIESLIRTVRGQRVMLDSDLAGIYGVALKRLNEQVRRNPKRFPADFAFQLTRAEFSNLKSQFATSSSHGGKRKLPWVFTEHGAIMLASVLNSKVAVEASVRVVRAFVLMRTQLSSLRRVDAGVLMKKLAQIEGRVGQHDAALKLVFTALQELLEPADGEIVEPKPRREIGFHVRENLRPEPRKAAKKK